MTAGISSGVLVITGDSNANTITVSQDDLLSGDEIDVDVNNDGSADYSFLVSNITANRIDVTGSGGGDTILFGNGAALQGGDEPVAVPANIDGGTGNDTIVGTDHNDSVAGGDGADDISTWDGNDAVNAGDGDDSVSTRDGNDIIYGGIGYDLLDGGNQNDLIYGGTGGTSSNVNEDDSVLGSDGNDSLFGEGGNDYIWGGNDTDILNGGDGNDLLDSNETDGDPDTLDGGAGTDCGWWITGEDTTFNMEGKF